jgi:hypothetical protein
MVYAITVWSLNSDQKIGSTTLTHFEKKIITFCVKLYLSSTQFAFSSNHVDEIQNLMQFSETFESTLWLYKI